MKLKKIIEISDYPIPLKSILDVRTRERTLVCQNSIIVPHPAYGLHRFRLGLPVCQYLPVWAGVVTSTPPVK